MAHSRRATTERSRGFEPSATARPQPYPPLLDKLTGGDRRSIGRSAEVVADVLADPALFAVLFQGLLVDDPLIRMRAADAIEKITAQHPEYLAPYKTQLLQEVGQIEQQEVRWHVAQLLSRLALTAEERRIAVMLLNCYLEDASKIVKTFAMQALADIALVDAELRPTIITQLETLTYTGSPAMQSRGKKLLAKLAAAPTGFPSFSLLYSSQDENRRINPSLALPRLGREP